MLAHEEFWMEGLGPFVTLAFVVFAVFVLIIVVRLLSRKAGGAAKSKE